MFFRWLRLGALNALIFPIPILLLLGAWLLYTTSGLQISLRLLNHYYLANQLLIGQVKGYWLGTIQLNQVQLPLKNRMTVTIDQINLHWHFDTLHFAFFSKHLQTQLDIAPLTLRHLSIRRQKRPLLTLPSIQLAAVIDFDQKEASLKTVGDPKTASSFNATYHWKTHPHWDYSLNVHSLKSYQLDTAYLPTLPTNTATAATTAAATPPVPSPSISLIKNLHFLLKGQGDNQQIKMTLSDLSAQFKNQTITAYSHWEANLDRSNWKTKTTLHFGQAYFQVEGKLDSTWALHWQLNIDNKQASLLPDITGQLTSQGEVTGPRHTPHIQGELKGQKLGFKSYKLDTFHSKINVDLSKQGHTHINITAKQLAYKKLRIQQIQIKGLGKTEEHQIHCTVSLPHGQYVIQAQGHWHPANRHWDGQIQTLDFFTSNHVKQWWLEQPFSLTASPSHLNIHPLRWTSKEGSLSLSGEWKKRKLAQLNLGVTHLTLSQIPIKIDPTDLFKLKGVLNGHLLFEQYWQQLPSLKGNLQFKSDETQLTLNKTTIILGQLKGELDALGDHLHYKIEATKQDGQLTLQGNTYFNRWFDTNNSTLALMDAQLEGHNFFLIDSPTLKIHVSPKIDINLYPKQLSGKGSVYIPSAFITPYDLHNTTQLTSDAVFTEDPVSASTAPSHPKGKAHSKREVHIDIALKLGPNVNINLKGLEGNLEGEVTLIQRPNHPLLANGQIMLLNSTYNQYGANLTVSRGILNFVNSPLNNPQVDIIAERKFEDINSLTGGLGSQTTLRAGVKIYGELKKLKTYLFSEPGGRSQSDILSMLILGQSHVDINDDNKLALLLQAATALNFGKNHTGIGSLANDLRHKLGLSELNVESETKVNDNSDLVLKNTSLVLGKYLSKNLYIRYSRGLQEPLNTLNLRYNLSRHFQLQTQTNEEGSGVDMLYTLEK